VKRPFALRINHVTASNFKVFSMSKRIRSTLLPLLLASLSFGIAGHALAASSTATTIAPGVRITAKVDDASRVTLSGNVRPEVARATDQGAVADTLVIEHMQLLLQRSAEQQAALQRTIDSLHDPKSPNYHRWLSAQKFGAQYGVAQADIASITAWLQAQHFQVNKVYPNALLIDFTGNAGAVRTAFHTEIHALSIHGARHIANVGDPQIPAALAPAIQGIVSLNDFRPHSQLKQRPKTARSQFSTSGGNYDVVPADLATIYNFNPVFTGGNTGQGQTIALIEDTDIYSAQDWTTFRNALGLRSYAGSLVQVHPSGQGSANNCTDPGVSSDDIEAIIDAEWASAAAPSARIELVSCANTTVTFGGLIAMQNLLNATSAPPAIISLSYGECEAGLGTSGNAAYAKTYEQAVTAGVSVFVSAGDDGAASCDAGQNAAYDGIAVNGFASTPNNVAVGGTDFNDYATSTTSQYWSASNSTGDGSALSYIPEIPWNASCASSVLLSFLITEGRFSSGIPAYGGNGLCNNPFAKEYALDSTVAGSGGPSNCASGSPALSGGLISGAGSCQGTAKPSWQSGVVGLPNDGVRDIPDVSLFASNGVWTHAYIACYSDLANSGSVCSGTPDTWTQIGGTSLAAPILAGIQALINQSTGSAQGNPNYVYYKLAASGYGSNGNAQCNSSFSGGPSASCVFYDVTVGDNVVNCYRYHCYGYSGSSGNPIFGVLSTSNSTNAAAFSAHTGWDFATGIGTVNVANLIRSWGTQ
jgi:subtilase family serine protease